MAVAHLVVEVVGSFVLRHAVLDKDGRVVEPERRAHPTAADHRAALDAAARDGFKLVQYSGEIGRSPTLVHTYVKETP